MSDLALAQLSMASLYSAMGVLTLAMLAYAAHLAWLLPARSEAKDLKAAQAAHAAERQRELAPVGGGPTAGGEHPAYEVGGDAPTEAHDDKEPLRARKAAGIAGALSILGTLLLTAAVVLRGLEVHRMPLGNMFEFAITGAMFVMLAYTGWSLRRDLRWLGVFITGPVLITLGMAVTVWYVDAAELMPSLKSYWLVIHVTIATIAMALFGIGAAINGLYLWQDRVEGGTTRSFMNRLPAARQLEKLAYGLHVIAFPLWTFTVIAGAIWARQAWGSYWNWDPKEVWSFVIWVVYAAYLHARVTSGWRRQNAAMIALAGFACIIVNYGIVNVFFVGQHSYSGL